MNYQHLFTSGHIVFIPAYVAAMFGLPTGSRKDCKELKDNISSTIIRECEGDVLDGILGALWPVTIAVSFTRLYDKAYQIGKKNHSS